MKREEILRKLKEAGMTLVEGGRHTLIYDKDGHYLGPVGRHKEIDDIIVRQIEKQTGVKLPRK